MNTINFFDDIGVYSDNTAIITEDGEQISYRALLNAADEIASFIPARKIVFLVCRNTFQSVAAYIGFLRKRVIPVLLSPDIDRSLLGDLLESYKPGYICCPVGWNEDGEQIYQNNGYVLVGTGHDVSVEPNLQLALLLTTSGSTGSPKLVRQSNVNIECIAASIVEYLKITADERPITTLPMHYTYGLSIINSHLLAGASMIMTDATLLEKKFWQLLKSQNATSFGGVPYTYEKLIKLRFDRT